MKDLEYKIVRSAKRKTLTITVERDRAVVVRAPEVMSDDEVHRLVDAKRQWILEKLRNPQKHDDAERLLSRLLDDYSRTYLTLERSSPRGGRGRR